jgi:hypothetical protein
MKNQEEINNPSRIVCPLKTEFQIWVKTKEIILDIQG